MSGGRQSSRSIDLKLRAQKARGYAFDLLRTTHRLQAALMSLAPRETAGEAQAHDDADLLIYVLSGSCLVTIGKTRHRLKSGQMLIIPAGKVHQVKNTG